MLAIRTLEPLTLKIAFDQLGTSYVNTNLVYLAIMAITLVGVTINRYGSEYTFLKTIIRLERDWPTMVLNKLLELHHDYHIKQNTGKKMSKVMRGVDRMIQTMITLKWQAYPAIQQLIVNTILIGILCPKAAVLFLTLLIPVVILQLRMQRRTRPMWKEYEKRREEAVGISGQCMVNVSTVQLAVAEEHVADVHLKKRNEAHDLDIEVSKIHNNYHFVIELFLMNACTATVCYGMDLHQHGKISLGTLVLFVSICKRSTDLLAQMQQTCSQMLKDFAGIERTSEVLEEIIEVANTNPEYMPIKEHQRLTFENVSLSYNKSVKPTIGDLNLTIPRGEMVALVGTTGAGKSTIVGMIGRRYDPTLGRIKLDDHDIREIDRDRLRRLIAMVPQTVDIFEGTLLYNICFGIKDPTTEQIEEAINAACLGDLVSNKDKFPKGLNTLIGERGVDLSGGERQRVGIARAHLAITNGAQILILDEATSSLDIKTEQIVQSFIEKLRKKHNITIVAIAHRLATIYKADRICFLKNGTITEEGSHKRLMQAAGEYYDLVKGQEFSNPETINA